MKPTVNAIIQARMGSKRLAGKTLARLAGKPLLAHVLERARAISGLNKVVLATSDVKDNLPLMELAASLQLESFAGSERNVLERYCMASKLFPSDYIVRITGDNPFTDVHFAEKTVELALKTGADLCSFNNLPLGTAVEVIKTETLHKTQQTANKAHHLEHVTPFIKEHPEQFLVVREKAVYDNPFKFMRLTVDTPEDLKLARIICDALYTGAPFGIDEIINFLKTRPELLEINSAIEQRPMTSAETDNDDTPAH